MIPTNVIAFPKQPVVAPSTGNLRPVAVIARAHERAQERRPQLGDIVRVYGAAAARIDHVVQDDRNRPIRFGVTFPNGVRIYVRPDQITHAISPR